MTRKAPLARYWQSMGPARRLIPVHLLCVVLAGLIASSPPLLVGLAVDHMQNTWSGAMLGVALGAVVLVGVLAIALCFLRDYLVTVIAEGAGYEFQCALYEHLQQLSADFYQANRVGEITARLTHDVNRGVRPLYRHMVHGATGVVMLLVAAVSLAWYAPVLFALFFVLTMINFGLTIWVLPQIRRNFEQLQDDNADLNAQITEAVSVHSLVRSCAREQEAQQRMWPLVDKLRDQQITAERFLWKFLVFIWSFEIILGPFLMLLLGAVLVQYGSSPGSLVAAVLYWRLTAEYKWKLTGGITGIMSGMGALSRAVAFFDKTPLVADAIDAQELAPGPGRIVFDAVMFRYPSNDDGFQLGPIHIDLAAGSRCALLGRSGSGKSTLAQLLCRVYDCASGSMCIDGQDLTAVTQGSLRQRIGFMCQETQLFEGSLRDNLHFVCPAADDAAMMKVLDEADLGGFVAALPEGLDTQVGERGIRLSGGQRQRLAIARLLLLDPGIIILDEATAALDADTEAAIWHSIDRLFAGRTQLVITHRVASALLANQILVLDAGQIQARGTAAALYDESDLFREFCVAQCIDREVL